MIDEELLHYGTKGMKWRKRKQHSPDISFHNSAAQRRAEQNAAIAALAAKPKSGKIKIKGPDIKFHNAAAKRRAEQNAALAAKANPKSRKAAKNKAKRKKVGAKVAKVKSMRISAAIAHRTSSQARLSLV